MDFQGIRPVFQVIGFLEGLPGKLLRFADRDEPGPQLDRQSPAENKTAGFHRNHGFDIGAFVPLGHPVDGVLEGFRIPKQRGDILKYNPFFG